MIWSIFFIPMRKKDSLLWQLTSDKTHHVSYLFGTMHVKDDIAYTHLEKALTKMKMCNLVACEYNLDQAAGRGMDGVYTLPDNKTLIDYLGEKKYEKIKKIIFKSFGFHLDQLSRLIPMAITSIISEQILSKDNAVSLDQKIWNEGILNEMEMAGVETFEGQADIMKKIELKYQFKMLKDICKNIPSFRKKILGLTDMYREQKIHQLYKVSKKSLGKYRNLLLFKRNINMAHSISKMALDNNAFIAVGAAHLSGRKGILYLLKEQGFTLKPC